jgi:cytochrome c oxidase assembly protein subunit 11
MSRPRRNSGDDIRRTGLKLAAVAVGMFVFGYALVPFYDVICRITGLNGKTGRAESGVAQTVDDGRWVTVEFTGNTMSGLPWEFRPLQRSVRVHPGAVTTVAYEVRNPTGETIVGQAVPSVAPSRAAAYMKKIECFCFSQQKLAAGERRDMPIRFFVDREIPKDVTTLTLSYAFFNTDPTQAKRFGGEPVEAQVGHDHHAHPAPAGG